ncbi:hypothetical protein DCAR_0521095 [Daucus carota subsp. sativus]|uniref:Cupin type-1 domain-containing protein n=1 Tax=Daucus carota subsp. sativus TaxID=79200 RepID=A0AAF0X597_DAUCS|nr:hypothetical protein DCAR_0521095 [Daucus carota subsp. sativus]
MSTIFFNSKAIKISVVTNGAGELQMGVVFVTPPHHPLTLIASNNQNLEVLCFEINARNNERTALAGQDNIFEQMEKVAKELAFNRPSQEVDETFGANWKKWFFKGPNQQQPGLRVKGEASNINGVTGDASVAGLLFLCFL